MFSCQSDFFFETGLHLGGIKSLDTELNVFNSILFFGKRKSFYIVDFKHFIYNFRIGLFFLYRLISLRGKVLGFDDRNYIRRCLVFFFKRANQHYIVKHWIGGTLTNFRNFQIFFIQIVRGILSIKKYYDFFMYFYGLKNMQQMPALIVLTNPNDAVVSLQESFRTGIPVMSLININTKNVSAVTFPIPGNNFEVKPLIFFYSIIGDSLLYGWLKPVSFFFNSFFKRLKYFRKKVYVYNSLYFSFFNSKIIFFFNKIVRQFKFVDKLNINFFFFSNFFYYLKKRKIISTNFIINLKFIRYKKFKKKFFKHSFFNFWFTRKVLKRKKLKLKKNFKKLFKYFKFRKKKKISIFNFFKKKVKFFLKKLINKKLINILKKKKKLNFILRYNRYKNYYKKLNYKAIYIKAMYEQEHLEDVLEKFDELPEERKRKALKKWEENFKKLSSKFIINKKNSETKILFVDTFNSNVFSNLSKIFKKKKFFYRQLLKKDEKKILNQFFSLEIRLKKNVKFNFLSKIFTLNKLLKIKNLIFISANLKKKIYILKNKPKLKNFYLNLLIQRRQSKILIPYKNDIKRSNKFFIEFIKNQYLLDND